MKTLQSLIASAALALLITAPAIAGTPVVLKDNLMTEGRITLGDLFDGAGRAAGVVVAQAPSPGGSVMIDAATVQRAAIANGLSWSNERGLRRIVVRSGAPAAGSAAAPASVPASKGVEVLTWTRSLAAGDVIEAEDLAWTSMAVAPAGAARDAEALIGKIAKRPLRSGAAAASRDVGAARVIEKDDMLTVMFQSGGVTLSLQAKAMGPAAVGEPVTVTNLSSKKVFQAIAAGPGRAVVGPQADALLSNQTLALR